MVCNPSPLTTREWDAEAGLHCRGEQGPVQRVSPILFHTSAEPSTVLGGWTKGLSFSLFVGRPHAVEIRGALIGQRCGARSRDVVNFRQVRNGGSGRVKGRLPSSIPT